MSDDKRTYQAVAHLPQNPRLQVRRPKANKRPAVPVSQVESEELAGENSMPVSQDLILRLIRLLKET